MRYIGMTNKMQLKYKIIFITYPFKIDNGIYPLS